MNKHADQSAPGLCIAVVANTSWNLFNFRLNLIRALQAAGHTVAAVTPDDAYRQKLRAAGMEVHTIPLTISGINPLAELRAVLRFRSVFKRNGIDLVLSYTPKGNLYAALACLTLGVPFVPNVSGLGRAFIRRSPVTWAALALYRLTFRRAHHVFFQNFDDLDLFVKAGLVAASKAERLPGSGVDLTRFAPATVTRKAVQDAPVFLLVARMLLDKGVGEYVEAARIIKKRFPKAQFRLLGALASGNPSAIPEQQVQSWVDEGLVTYLGGTEDVRPYLAEADCVVLPSYREGVPRVLLEAAATGLPLITTDAPGCRDAVRHGVTGLICKPRDAMDLARAMNDFIALSDEQRAAMGRAGRAFVEENFDEQLVIDRYQQLVSDFAASRNAARLRGQAYPAPASGTTGA
ncbi:MAG: glycosyltransferase family 4 protein [Pseudomonadota bacterium]